MSASEAIRDYLSKTPAEKIESAMLAYVANLSLVAQTSPEVASSIVAEVADQRSNLKLIASENFCSMPTQLAMGNLLTDKYAEGVAGHRFYAGCDNVDAIESEASAQACKLFGAEHAFTQPHSGCDANLIAFWGILNARTTVPALEELGQTNPSKLSDEQWASVREKCGNQRMLGMDYYSGGHLTHGYRMNLSAQMFEAHTYAVDRESGLLDLDALEVQAEAVRPLILLAGYSAYPRKINFRRMREIADKVGAVLMVDMAHFAGLVAGKVFTGDYDPVAHAQVVTSTTHKTLRGPRGGIVLCDKEFAEHMDKACPLVMGGPLPHVIGAKAVAFTEANRAEFASYAAQIVTNAQALAAACVEEGITIATGGTDNHLMLIDVRSFGLTGRQAESAVRRIGITLNRNSLPFDPNGPWYTSGLRLGTPAVTSLGMDADDMSQIAHALYLVLSNTQPTLIEKGANKGQPSKAKFTVETSAEKEASKIIQTLLTKHPLYPELDLEFLQSHFS